MMSQTVQYIQYIYIHNDIHNYTYTYVDDDDNFYSKSGYQSRSSSKIARQRNDQHDFRFGDIDSYCEFDEYGDEDNVDEVLDKTLEEIQQDIEEDYDKMHECICTYIMYIYI